MLVRRWEHAVDELGLEATIQHMAVGGVGSRIGPRWNEPPLVDQRDARDVLGLFSERPVRRGDGISWRCRDG